MSSAKWMHALKFACAQFVRSDDPACEFTHVRTNSKEQQSVRLFNEWINTAHQHNIHHKQIIQYQLIVKTYYVSWPVSHDVLQCTCTVHEHVHTYVKVETRKTVVSHTCFSEAQLCAPCARILIYMFAHLISPLNAWSYGNALFHWAD